MTSPDDALRHDLETDLALRKVVADLAYRYDGVFSRETVDQLVHESYDQLAASATVTTYLPMLTERFARDRLLAVAQAEGKIAKATPEVLFICVHNAGRSQMAAAWTHHLSGGRSTCDRPGRSPGTESARWPPRRWPRSVSTWWRPSPSRSPTMWCAPPT